MGQSRDFTGNAMRRRPTRPQAAVTAIVVVVIAALGTGLIIQAAQSGSPGSSPGPTSVAAASPTAASPGSSAVTDWSAVELAKLAAVATLETTDQDGAGIAPDATLTLASLTEEPARAIAERLQVSPATEFTIAPSADGRTATLTPKAALLAGATYRIALRTPDGALAGSWAYHVRGPIRVTSTIPGDATTNVPVRAGIEVTFDQDDVATMQSHFTISPVVEGTFERHGRTQVFVPAKLEPATLYTVTVRRGLTRTGTDLLLEKDAVFRFETEGPAGPPVARLHFGRDVVEVGPGERPVVAVNVIAPQLEDDTRVPAPTTANVNVYRLPSLDAASAALSAFLATPRWTEFSDPLMPTDGLPVVARFEAKLEALGQDALLVRFPEALDEGWYVIELPGTRVTHAFLQVTPVSAWVAVLSDRTVVWVNDVTTGRAVRDATVALDGGAVFGRSGADGLAIAATPAGIIPPAAAPESSVEALAPPTSPILRVTSPAGKTVLVPFGVAGSGETYRGEWFEKSVQADATYWTMLYTDRALYRRDDTIAVWGYLRGRDDGAVPTSVDIRLVPSGADRSPGVPSIVTVTAKPGKDGSFTATLPVAGLPLGGYEVRAMVDGRVVVSRWLEVTVIRKPAYQLDLVPNHRAVISGTKVDWTATATFFDGTPVPALDLRLADSASEGDRIARTDASGIATESIIVKSEEGAEEEQGWSLGAGPVGPEGAEISVSGSTLVFPSAYDLDAQGVISSGRLMVDGSLHQVDLAKVERAIAAGTWSGDAAGRAVGGKRIAVTVTEIVPVRRLVGNEYDFIEKIVRPRYEYDIQRKTLDSLTVVSGADGRIRFSLAVPNVDHEYEVVLSIKDGAGRLQRRTVMAGLPFESVDDRGVAFAEADGRTAGEKAYGIGDRITWKMTDDGRAIPGGGEDRYLYLIAQRGLRSATVTDAAALRHTFTAGDAPGIFVIGVRFTGTTYAPKAAAWANFDQAERALKVEVTADHARYRPGETATLSIRTIDTTGHPVAASVVLQAVDQKLYAMGGATVPRPLDDLYQRVDSGILRLTATHQVPSGSGPEGEGGDTTGGGRSDFKDTLVFREIRTDATGRASTTVKLSDDLTSWHITAGAVTADLRAGVGDLLIPVGLPFFVEVTIADGYLLSDRPVIGLRAFGDALRAGDPIEFTVESPTLALAATRVTGTAFKASTFELPALSLGRRSIVVGATATTRTGKDGKPLSDRLTSTFEVVESRLTAARTAYGTIGDNVPTLAGTSGLTTYTFADAGRGAVVRVLLGLAEPGGARLDRLIAQSVARDVLIAEFGRTSASLPPLDFDLSRYPVSEDFGGEGELATPGVGLLPWSGPDPWLAVRVALTAPDALNRDNLRSALSALRNGSDTKRDLAIAALAGLASLGEPVLADLQAAGREPDLTTTERLYLALGYAAAGDEPSAIAIERDLLERDGERLGAWVRLRTGADLDATVDATSLMMILAGSVGDPLASDMADYIVANPASDTVHDLDLAAYATRLLERTPAAAASFAYTVDGSRTVVSMKPGEAFSLSLTNEQRSTLRLEPISGKVGVTLEGRVVVAPATLDPHPDLTLTRATLGSPVTAGRIVVIDLTATFAAQAPIGCYDVMELVPSGLAPLSVGLGETDEAGVTWPTSVVGQEVRFCAANDVRTGHSARLQYRARVVNEGTFAWEPAVMQLPGAPELLAVTPTRTLVIQAP